MPELPEVETTLRGISPFLEKRRVLQVTVYNSNLRWPVSAEISKTLPGKTVRAIRRRAKYLILDVADGHVLIHLGNVR